MHIPVLNGALWDMTQVHCGIFLDWSIGCLYIGSRFPLITWIPFWTTGPSYLNNWNSRDAMTAFINYSVIVIIMSTLLCHKGLKYSTDFVIHKVAAAAIVCKRLPSLLYFPCDCLCAAQLNNQEESRLYAVMKIVDNGTSVTNHVSVS